MRSRIVGGTVVAYQDGEHRILTDGEVGWEGARLTYVGPRRTESADNEIDATGQLVIPGLISTHMHWGTQAGFRLLSDHGRREFFQTGYLNVIAVPDGKAGANRIENPAVGGRYAFMELLRGGVTTAVDVGGGSEALAHVAADIGIRAYLGPGYASGRHIIDKAGEIRYSWDEAAGYAGLDRAVAFVEWLSDLGTDRLGGMLFPLQVDTCSPDLLAASARAAAELGVGMQIHTGQNLHEFHQVLTRYSRTPVELLAESGALGPRTILGHCLLTTAHPFAHLPEGNDLALISDSRASVAHSPLVFARRGNALHSFSRYGQAGINMCLGTDVYPRDLISEMRLAGLLSKVVDQTYRSGTARELFDAATVGAARALARSDLGRLASGAMADIAVVNLRSLRIGPFRDPIRALIDCAVADDVTTVVVDGEVVLERGRFVREAADETLAAAQSFADDAWDHLADWHLGIAVDEYAPPTYRPFAQ